MKKRKELDALLTMANGKKNGKSKRSKEGHELLRLDSESISSDNDELFLAPKKTVVRRPRSCQCCTMCVPLVMFILTMGCMVITGGLIWMHFNLKQDLDNLRRSLKKVEIKADSATSQQATILGLESGLEKFNGIPEKVDTADIKIRKLNESLSSGVQARQSELDTLNARIEALEGKASSTSAADLQQKVADFGSEIEDLKTKNGVQEEKISGFELKITELTSEISTLKDQVAILQNPPTTLPSEEVVQPATQSVPTTRHPATNPDSSAPSSPQLVDVKEDITKIWTAVHEVQSTARNLSREHEEVVASLTRLQQMLLNGSTPRPAVPTTVAGQSSSSPQSIQAGQFDLAQMKADIELLKEEYNRSIASMPITDMPVLGESTNFNATWMQSLTDKISIIEEKVDQLNAGDGSSHLININQTDSMQMLLERSLSQFKDDNLADVTSLQSDVAATQTDIIALQTDVHKLQLAVESAETFDNEVGTRITAIQDQISTLRQDCSSCSTSGTSSTAKAEAGSVPIQDPATSQQSPVSPSSSVTPTSERTTDGTS